MAKKIFYTGQQIDGKIVKEVFRNMNCTHYLVTFTDGTSQIFNF